MVNVLADNVEPELTFNIEIVGAWQEPPVHGHKYTYFTTYLVIC